MGYQNGSSMESKTSVSVDYRICVLPCRSQSTGCWAPWACCPFSRGHRTLCRYQRPAGYYCPFPHQGLWKSQTLQITTQHLPTESPTPDTHHTLQFISFISSSPAANKSFIQSNLIFWNDSVSEEKTVLFKFKLDFINLLGTLLFSFLYELNMRVLFLYSQAIITWAQ